MYVIIVKVVFRFKHWLNIQTLYLNIRIGKSIHETRSFIYLYQNLKVAPSFFVLLSDELHKSCISTELLLFHVCFPILVLYTLLFFYIYFKPSNLTYINIFNTSHTLTITFHILLHFPYNKTSFLGQQNVYKHLCWIKLEK